jgi:capsular polysaccharide transport system permease protein
MILRDFAVATQAPTSGFFDSVHASASAFADWCAIIGLLTVQEFGEKYRGTRLETLVTFVEPFLLVLMLCAIKGVFRDQLPAFGTSIFVFYSSGIFPWYIFRRVSGQARSIQYDANRRFPRVTSTDVLIASAIAEATTMTATMIIWFFVMWFVGWSEAAPASPLDCAAPLGLLIALAVGMGLLNSAMTRRFKLWHFVYGKLTYHLAFLSGVMTVVDILPLKFRDILVWNPLTHAIEWSRVGLYGHYPHSSLDKDYLINFTCVVLMVGIVAHRATLRIGRK